MKKIRIRNAVIKVFTVFAAIFFMKTLVFNKKEVTEISKPQQSPPLSAEVPEPQPVQPKPWVFDRQTVNPKNNSRMDWSVPTTSLNQATEWFNVENVSYWGYRVKSDCLIEYKFKDITRKNVVVKIEYKNSNHYTEGTTELWKPDRLLEVVDNTAEMRFIPLPGQSLVGPTIYRSE